MKTRVWLIAGLCAALGACTGATDPSPDPTTSPSPSQSPTQIADAEITLGVYGQPSELAAFARAVSRFNSSATGANATLVNVADGGSVKQAIDSGDPLADVFMIDGNDLDLVMKARANQPVETLLDERGVRFGDDFKRDALLAFSADSHLQCMPYDASPKVMFINTDLIDIQRLPEVGLPVPTRPYTWSLGQFTALVELAARPHRGVYGTTVEPSLDGLLPYLYSTGESPFDDPANPTTLNLSNPDLRAPLELALELLRRPRLTIPAGETKSPLELFKAGRLGAMPGYHSIVPELRTTRNLNFDVMPIPSNGAYGTTANFTALCISRDSENLAHAADLLTLLVGADAMGDVADQGYLVPSNSLVAASDAFIQPNQSPAGADVFNLVMRSVELAPEGLDMVALSDAVSAQIRQLMTMSVLDLDTLLPAIDAASLPAFKPQP